MGSFLNYKKINHYKNILKNVGLCSDGTDESFPDDPKQKESIFPFESLGQLAENKTSVASSENDSKEILDEASNTETVKTPTSAQSLEASSYQSIDTSTSIAKNISDLLSAKPKGNISDLKDSMKEKLFRMIYDEENISTQTADYTNLEKKKKEAIERQVKIINRTSDKRKKQTLKVRQYFFITKKKKPPAWKDEIELSGSSVTELNTDVEEPEELSTEYKVEYPSESNAVEKKEQSQVCEDSDISISCLSEIYSESRCNCSLPNCTCNEYERFQNYLLKKYGGDEKIGEVAGEAADEAADEKPKLTKENVDLAATSMELAEAERDSRDIYDLLSRLLEESDAILNFNIVDYMPSDEEPEPGPVEYDASSYGSFDPKHRYNIYKKGSFLNYKKTNHCKNILKNEGLLCFDGTDESFPDDPKQKESKLSVESLGQPDENKTSIASSENDSKEILDEAPNTETVKTPTSAQSLEASSYQSIDPFTSFGKNISDLLSAKPKGNISNLKDSMKTKLFRKVYDEEYILTKIDDYTNLEKKKKEAIERQVKIINRISVKRKKPTSKVRKYFYITTKKKPSAWKDEIESSGSSVTELNTEVEEPEELSTESKVEYPSESNALEKKEQSQFCEDSDKSISCPSETGSESRCKCSMPHCTCNEYVRFQNYLSKKYGADEKSGEAADEAADEKPKLTEENVDRWDDLCNLDDVSHWSEETILEVSSTSSSSCGIVRKCHCSHCNCGCDEYREYLLYKLYQVTRRRRKRNNRRAEKAETLRRIIEENYKEDEYNKTVREFINEYYVKEEGPESKKPNVCSCGLYNCECRDFEKSPKERSEGKKKRHVDISEEFGQKSGLERLNSRGSSSESREDEKRKVRFGSEDSSSAQPQNSNPSGSVVSQKSMSSKGSLNKAQAPPITPVMSSEAIRVSAATSMGPAEAENDSGDIYDLLSRLLEESDTILNFNIDDYMPSDEEPEPDPVESDASSYGSFDYKKYLVEKECDCEDYVKYFNYKQKTRRLAEKADPLLKYLRKRLLYVANLTKAEKLLDHTSSETESPVRVPEMRICQKYNVDVDNVERKKKIFKKKKRKLEKKVILDIIKKGCHLYPCECNIWRRRKNDPTLDESLLCEQCQVHLKSENKIIKTKIEPSIPLEEMDEKDCVLGLARTFPDCPTCKESVQRIQFTDKVDHKMIADDDEYVSSSMMKESGRDSKESKKDQEELKESGTFSLEAKPSGQGDIEPKITSKNKGIAIATGKGKKVKSKKGKKKKGGKGGKKKKGAAKKKNKKKGKKSAGKKKKKKPKKKPNEVYYYTEIPLDSNEKGLDVTISIFDPRVVYKFSDCE